MTVGEIYDFCLFLANKDEEGGEVRIEDFNLIINAVNLEMLENEWDRLLPMIQMSGRTVESLIHANSPLSAITVLTSGEITDKLAKPSDFSKLIRLTVTGSVIKSVEQVNESELARMRAGVSDRSIEHNSVCVVRNDGIYIYPHENKAPCDLVYIKVPATPYYDYYITSDDEKVYLPPGYKVRKVKAGEDYIYTVYNGTTVIATNVSYPNYTSDTASSLSVELEWARDAHIMFANRVVEKLGIPMQQTDLEQYSQIEQQKGE